MNKEEINNQEVEAPVEAENTKESREVSQSNVAHNYIQEYKNWSNLSSSWQKIMNSLDKLHDEGLLSGDSEIILKLKDEQKSISSFMDDSTMRMRHLFDQLSDESKEKYLKHEKTESGVIIQDETELGREKDISLESPEVEMQKLKDEIYNDTDQKSLYEHQKRQDKVDFMDKKIKQSIARLKKLQSGSDEPISQEDEEKTIKEVLTEKSIKGSDNINDLRKHIIKDNISISGSDGYIYSPNELVGIINDVLAGQKTLRHITSSMGLRKKVQEILEIEAIKNKK